VRIPFAKDNSFQNTGPFLLGDESGDRSKWLHLLQCMCKAGMVGVKDTPEDPTYFYPPR